jgi:hypothetical protein
VSVPVVAAFDDSDTLGNNSTISYTIPSGWLVGDYVVAFLTHGVRTVSSAPSGWTLIRAQSGDANVSAYGKTLVSGDPGSSPTWTLNATSFQNTRILYLRVTGAADTGTIDGDAGAVDGTAVTSHVSPAVTTTGPDRLILRLFTSNGQVLTPSSGDTGTEIVAGTTLPSLAAFRSSLASAGSTGTATYTTALARNFTYITAAIAPASGPSVSIPAIYYAVNRR